MAADFSSREAPSQDAKLIERWLQAGLGASALLMIAGLAVQISSGERISTAVGLFELGRRGKLPLGEQLMGLGILILALTPALRVVMLAFLWLRERDYRFVIVSIAVVLTLALAIVLGEG